MRLLIARGVADRWKGLCLDGVTPSFHATPLPPLYCTLSLFNSTTLNNNASYCVQCSVIFNHTVYYHGFKSWWSVTIIVTTILMDVDIPQSYHDYNAKIYFFTFIRNVKIYFSP